MLIKKKSLREFEAGQKNTQTLEVKTWTVQIIVSVETPSLIRQEARIKDEKVRIQVESVRDQ
jgi:hypothetical protein